MPEKSTYLAGHRRVALLNDALLRRLSGPVSGRIAQLVEQMTLNHRVPGSSPGAPTKLFKHLAAFAAFIPTNYCPSFRQSGWFCSLGTALLNAGD
jgi:hypothetical protein